MVSDAGRHSQVQCSLLITYSEDLANQIATTTVSADLVVIQVTDSNKMVGYTN